MGRHLGESGIEFPAATCDVVRAQADGSPFLRQAEVFEKTSRNFFRFGGRAVAVIENERKRGGFAEGFFILACKCFCVHCRCIFDYANINDYPE